MPTTSNFGWTTPADTDLVKDGAAAIRTLGNGIDTSFIDLKGGTTGQVLSKSTNTDLDFTWITPNDADAIQNTIIDAKGDLIVGSAADTPSRLAVGTNNFVLTADSAETLGMKWAALPSPTVTFAGCSLYGTGEINYSSNTNTEVTWQNEEFDTDGYHSTSSNTGRITIPSGKAGKYLFNGQFEIDDNANSSRTIKLYKNGAEVKSATVYQVASVGRGTIAINVILDLAVSDYVQAYVFATASSYVNKTQIRSWLQAAYLGA